MEFITKKIFQTLEGNWKLNRVVQGEKNAVVHGTARFSKLKDELNALHYREEVEVKTNISNIVHAYREYVYRYDEKSEKIMAFFVEGENTSRLFHAFKLNALTDTHQHHHQASAKHFCAQDIYDIFYEFYDTNRFKIIYTVYGPTKNYISESLFERGQSKIS